MVQTVQQLFEGKIIKSFYDFIICLYQKAMGIKSIGAIFNMQGFETSLEFLKRKRSLQSLRKKRKRMTFRFIDFAKNFLLITLDSTFLTHTELHSITTL